MSYVLLDIDGVLNTGKRHENGYCGIEEGPARELNFLLRSVPDAKICVISSWRYDVHSGRMTAAGMEAMLLSHGIDCYGRVYGVTASDEEIVGHARTRDWLQEHGAEIRRVQVTTWLFGRRQVGFNTVTDEARASYVVLDDMDLGIDRQVVVDKTRGLTREDVLKAIETLGVVGSGDVGDGLSEDRLAEIELHLDRQSRFLKSSKTATTWAQDYSDLKTTCLPLAADAGEMIAEIRRLRATRRVE